MKRTTYMILTAAVVFAAACQSEILPDGEVPGGESTLCFQPTLGGSTGTKSNVDNGGLTNPDTASLTKATELVATDGSFAIPLTCTVSDGIGEPAAPQTKGTQQNTSGDWDALGEYVDKFYVAAWKGGSSFIPADTEVTKGTTLWKTSTDYRWAATEDATFYAYANLPESGATIDATSSAQALEHTVPTASSAQQDILMGYYQGTPGYDETLHKGGIAEVKFYHPLTAVRFKKGSFEGFTDEQVEFKSISIKGVYTSGTATMNPTTMLETDCGDFFDWDTEGSSTQTVTMTPESGTSLTVDANGFIGDTFLLIPQTMTTTAPVTISAVVNLNGTEKKFDAKLTDNSWEAGKTNVYTLGNSPYVFTVNLNKLVFDNTYESMAKVIKTFSYKTSNSVNTPLGYKAYRSNDGGNTWKAFGSSSSDASYLKPDNDGSIDASDKKINENNRYFSGTPVPIYYWADDMVEASEWDLSKCSIGGEYNSSNLQNTANCYIIKHPGSYKFPCVYGNAIKNGSTNSASYSTSTTGARVLQNLVNARGSAITSPYILTDLGLTDSDVKAVLLWTDRLNLIGNVSYSDGYISFETLPKTSLAEGNAVIVLYQDTDNNNAYTNGEALWSWQIWVSHFDLSSSNVFSGTDTHGKQHSFMCREVGFITGDKYQYPSAGNYIIKLVQEESNNELYIDVQRPETSVILPGSCSFYQFGRPTAFPGLSKTSPTGSIKRMTLYDENGNDVSSIVSWQNDVFSSAMASTSKYSALQGCFIANPNLLPSDENTGTADRNYANLWSINLDQVLLSSNYYKSDLPDVVKTIYDPCPHGYCVPNPQAYEYFTSGKNQINYEDDPTFQYLRILYDDREDKKCLFPLDGSLNRNESVKFLLGGYMSPGSLNGSNIWMSMYNHTSALYTDGLHSVTFILGKGGSGFRNNSSSTNGGFAIHPVLETNN